MRKKAEENAREKISTNGKILGEKPKRSGARERRFKEAVEKVNQKYADLFRRLSE
jgi:hypothetical protein